MNIYLLAHSGVAVEQDERILVFDYWQDPAQHMATLRATGKPIYMFVTHEHADHYRSDLAELVPEAAAFVLDRDCRGGEFPADRTQYTGPGERLTVGDMTVHVHGSTDAGSSFLVETPTATIFHAGDLNWWHWTGDPDSANEEMRAMFFRELEPAVARTADIVFFPVDDRQGPAQEWGVIEYLQRMTPRQLLVPIHRNGAPWEPSLYWRWRFAAVPVWLGLQDGSVYGREGATHE